MENSRNHQFKCVYVFSRIMKSCSILWISNSEHRSTPLLVYTWHICYLWVLCSCLGCCMWYLSVHVPDVTSRFLCHSPHFITDRYDVIGRVSTVQYDILRVKWTTFIWFLWQLIIIVTSLNLVYVLNFIIGKKHSIYWVQYYLQFQISAGSLELRGIVKLPGVQFIFL